jgi:hypothetical protein
MLRAAAIAGDLKRMKQLIDNGVDPNGGAVRVDPIKNTWKAAGTERLNLKYQKLLSNFAFIFNLRRYPTASTTTTARRSTWRRRRASWRCFTTCWPLAGAHTRPLFSST